MKKLTLFFGFALMGVLFFACQKDGAVQEQSTVDTSEVVSVERTHHHCGHDPNDCMTTCISYGMCCCTIEWYYDTSDSLAALEPIPTFCVAKDECTDDPDCVIICDETEWASSVYNLCESGTSTLTFLCVSKNTAISITNPSANYRIFAYLSCNGSLPTPPYTIQPWQTVQIGFNNSCGHRRGC